MVKSLRLGVTLLEVTEPADRARVVKALRCGGPARSPIAITSGVGSGRVGEPAVAGLGSMPGGTSPGGMATGAPPRIRLVYNGDEA